jgi:hypothetical protein
MAFDCICTADFNDFGLTIVAEIKKDGQSFSKFTLAYPGAKEKGEHVNAGEFIKDTLTRAGYSMHDLGATPKVLPNGFACEGVSEPDMMAFEHIVVKAAERLLGLGVQHAKHRGVTARTDLHKINGRWQ